MKLKAWISKDRATRILKKDRYISKAY